MTDQIRKVAGRYGVTQVRPTRDEIARGYVTAWQVVDMSDVDSDGLPALIGSAVCSETAAYRQCRELARYEREGGEALNSLAIAEWALELTGRA